MPVIPLTGQLGNRLTDESATEDIVDMIHKIKTIEKEVTDLKLTFLKKLTPTGKKVISLKGILKGVDISEKDISDAKKSLYCKSAY